MKANASPVAGLAGQIEANLTHDESDRMSLVRAPTLVTVGELDMCLPPFFSRELADGISDAELVVFPGGSHLFGMQDPGTFNRVDARLAGKTAGVCLGRLTTYTLLLRAPTDLHACRGGSRR